MLSVNWSKFADGAVGSHVMVKTKAVASEVPWGIHLEVLGCPNLIDVEPGRTVQHHYVAGALYDAGVVYVAGANPSLHTPSGTSSIYVAGANGCSGSLGQQVRKHFCQIQHHQRLLAASSKFAGKPPCDLESLVPSANVGAAWAYTSWKIFTTGKATPIGPALPRTHEI